MGISGRQVVTKNPANQSHYNYWQDILYKAKKEIKSASEPRVENLRQISRATDMLSLLSKSEVPVKGARVGSDGKMRHKTHKRYRSRRKSKKHTKSKKHKKHKKSKRHKKK
jgi:hypothetical protein